MYAMLYFANYIPNLLYSFLEILSHLYHERISITLTASLVCWIIRTCQCDFKLEQIWLINNRALVIIILVYNNIWLFHNMTSTHQLLVNCKDLVNKLFFFFCISSERIGKRLGRCCRWHSLEKSFYIRCPSSPYQKLKYYHPKYIVFSCRPQSRHLDLTCEINHRNSNHSILFSKRSSTIFSYLIFN